jgi:hypothetical protein
MRPWSAAAPTSGPSLPKGAFVGTFTPLAQDNCGLPTAGPAGAAALTGLTDAQGNPILVVVGNNPAAPSPSPGLPSIPSLYGLDAVTGQSVWNPPLPLAPTGSLPDPNSFGWGSPAIYSYSDATGLHWRAYVGLSSFNDCPLVQGRVLGVDLTSTGATVTQTFDVVPSNNSLISPCVGGGVWSTPAIAPNPSDPSNPYIWVSTGNGGDGTNGNTSTCGSKQLTALSCMYPSPNPNDTEPYTQALLELQVVNTSLQVVDCYQERNFTQDDDFGASPTFFTVSGGSTNMVGLINKDGHFYVSNQGNFPFNASPTYDIVVDQASTKQYGNGSIASAAWDSMDNYLYVGVGAPAGGYNSCPNPQQDPTVGALYVFNLSQLTSDPTAPFPWSWRRASRIAVRQTKRAMMRCWGRWSPIRAIPS